MSHCFDDFCGQLSAFFLAPLPQQCLHNVDIVGMGRSLKECVYFVIH